MCAQVRDRWVREIQKKLGQADAKIKEAVSNSSNGKMSRRKNKRKPKEGMLLCPHGGLEPSVLIGPVQKRSWGTTSENNVHGSHTAGHTSGRFPGTMLNLSLAHIRRKQHKCFPPTLIWDSLLHLNSIKISLRSYVWIRSNSAKQNKHLCFNI